jgi:CheY-like chemotaxis protein
MPGGAAFLSIGANSKARFNLSKASVLMLDSTTLGMSVLVQIIKGFGAQTIHRCTNVEDARDVAARQPLHLIIADALSPTGAGYDFVQWVRRDAPEPNCFCPIIIIEGHTRAIDVARARDSGANFMLKRPMSPLALMERIIWIGHEDRGFIIGPTYAGPDRRFHDEGPPKSGGRRWNDKAIAADPGDAAETPEPPNPPESLEGQP